MVGGGEGTDNDAPGNNNRDGAAFTSEGAGDGDRAVASGDRGDVCSKPADPGEMGDGGPADKDDLAYGKLGDEGIGIALGDMTGKAGEDDTAIGWWKSACPMQLT
jgi:hypothetical protein